MKQTPLLHAVIPAKAGIQCLFGYDNGRDQEQGRWVPAFAGMTSEEQGIVA
jgi:hypothetical protein